LANALKKKGYRLESPEIVAVTGWRTDDLKKAVKTRGLARDYHLVSLLIGVNNQYQNRSLSQYAREFDELLEIAIDHAGGNKSGVFVLSIPDYGYTPFGSAKRAEISKQIDAFNAVNRKITTKRKVTYIDITDISRRGLVESDLVAGDGLHPSGKMYTLWVEKILENLE
jgi:lysophospholipase L1-like esterase